jgi:hypothetical protein
MTANGVFAVSRAVFDHPIFAPEPYTEREAWLWLCGAAVWQTTRVRAGRALIELSRGQLAFSNRFLATKWRWSEARVRRFLKRLKIDAMIATQATHQTTHITICNYDKYAFGRRTDEQKTDAQTDAEATHKRRKEEEGLRKIKKEEEKETTLFSDWPSDAFELFWRKYPERVGKKAALKALAAAKRTGATWAHVMFGLDRYIAEKPPDRAWCHPSTWLNGRRWDDEPSVNGGKSGTANRQSPSDRAYELAEKIRQYEITEGIGRPPFDVGGDHSRR